MTTSEAIDVAEILRRHPEAFSGGARLIPVFAVHLQKLENSDPRIPTSRTETETP